ncbi:MAG: hypothetical protein ACU843_12675 [Gammaproteobacteria bacterium]
MNDIAESFGNAPETDQIQTATLEDDIGEIMDSLDRIEAQNQAILNMLNQMFDPAKGPRLIHALDGQTIEIPNQDEGHL